MSYLQTIEFLVKEVAKANEQIESLIRKLELKETNIKQSCERFEEEEHNHLQALEDLKQMTIEKDHWKAEALEYRDKESEWFKEKKQYETKIKGLSDAVDRHKAYYLGEADLVGELQDELKNKDSAMDGLEDSLTRMSEELGLTKKRYEALLETNRKKDKMHDNKVQELQLEINHLKRNK
jgi:chromosome segregation ATPase